MMEIEKKFAKIDLKQFKKPTTDKEKPEKVHKNLETVKND